MIERKTSLLESPELQEESFFAQDAAMPIGEYLAMVKLNLEVFRERYNNIREKRQ